MKIPKKKFIIEASPSWYDNCQFICEWNVKILFLILMLLKEDESVLVDGSSGEWGRESQEWICRMLMVIFCQGTYAHSTQPYFMSLFVNNEKGSLFSLYQRGGVAQTWVDCVVFEF